MNLFQRFKKKKPISDNKNAVAATKPADQPDRMEEEKLADKKVTDQPKFFTAGEEPNPSEGSSDLTNCTGKDFEFLIRGDIDISNESFDEIMTPNSFLCTKLIRDGWQYYIIGGDEFSYSFEPPGIQMTFNDEIKFSKAKDIADEVINNIRNTGQEAELVILSTNQVYKFN